MYTRMKARPVAGLPSKTFDACWVCIRRVQAGSSGARMMARKAAERQPSVHMRVLRRRRRRRSQREPPHEAAGRGPEGAQVGHGALAVAQEGLSLKVAREKEQVMKERDGTVKRWPWAACGRA